MKFVCMRILLIVPTTVALAKRNLSKLKLINSYLWSAMLQDRLNGLNILYIENLMLDYIEFKSLICNFAAQKA